MVEKKCFTWNFRKTYSTVIAPEKIWAETLSATTRRINNIVLFYNTEFKAFANSLICFLYACWLVLHCLLVISCCYQFLTGSFTGFLTQPYVINSHWKPSPAIWILQPLFCSLICMRPRAVKLWFCSYIFVVHIQVLIDWVNNELVDQRIIVKDIQEDLFDGQVLQKLLEKLGNIKLQVTLYFHLSVIIQCIMKVKLVFAR